MILNALRTFRKPGNPWAGTRGPADAGAWCLDDALLRLVRGRFGSRASRGPGGGRRSRLSLRRQRDLFIRLGEVVETVVRGHRIRLYSQMVGCTALDLSNWLLPDSE